jgi:hypothetical protein
MKPDFWTFNAHDVLVSKRTGIPDLVDYGGCLKICFMLNVDEECPAKLLLTS